MQEHFSDPEVSTESTRLGEIDTWFKQQQNSCTYESSKIMVRYFFSVQKRAGEAVGNIIFPFPYAV